MTQMLATLHTFSVQLPTAAATSPPSSATASPASASAGGASSGNLGGFSVQSQLQSQWCWAAVSTSVAVFYSVTQWTQCQVAADELPPHQCCGSAASGPCNIPWYLDRALARVGHYVSIQGGNTPFATVAGEINAGKPLCCRIGWRNGGGHFIALGAYSTDATGKQWVDVHDPFYGYVQIGYADFISGYKTPGDQWTHSYFTSRNAAMAGGAAFDPNAPLSA